MVSKKASPPTVFLTGWRPTSKADEKDELESERVGGIVDSERNKCYWNARKVIRSLPDYSDASYVEGFVVSHLGGIFEHGWIAKDGKVIDPTILYETKYFPGLEFKGSEQIREFLETQWGSPARGCPFHKAFGEFGFDSPHFKESFREARQYLSSAFGTEAMETAATVRPQHGLPWPDDW